VGELLDPGDDHATVEAVRHRSVTATGTYEDDATVAVRNRTQDGVAGAWLVTPLHLEGGEGVGGIRGLRGAGARWFGGRGPGPGGGGGGEGGGRRSRRARRTGPARRRPAAGRRGRH